MSVASKQVRDMFPPEVIERILLHCDGKTIKAAESVCVGWREIVEYLAQKHDLWRRCVHHDIPEQELIQYKTKWVSEDGGEPDWEQLYENWSTWHDIKVNIQFHNGTTWKINKIACIAVIGQYVAIGLNNGCVKVYDKVGYVVKAYRNLILPVKSIHFVRPQPDPLFYELPSELLIAYNDKVFINDLRDTYMPGIFTDSYIFSAYKHFICGVSQDGHITIARVSSDDENRKKSFKVLTYVRIYSPDRVKSCALGEGVCIILVNDKLRTINYKEGSKSSHFMSVELTTLQFGTVTNLMMRRDVFVFNDKVVITVTRSIEIMQQQLFELFILNDEDKSNSKKMFIPWRLFNAFITCVYLYGNTLVIGLNTGSIYFYVITDWKLFDISNYAQCISMPDVGIVPIISIDTVECYGRREFYIASNTFVRKLIGETVI